MNGGPQPPRRRRPRPYDTSPRPARNVFDYLPVISLLIFLLAVGGVMIAVSAWLSPAGDPVAVPGFMGMQFERASKEADRAHLRLHVIARRPDFHAAKDVVVGQLPAAGEKVRSGRTIDIILSAGTPMVKTPNLSNLSLRDAQLALENGRLELGSVQEQNNTDVIAGQVLEQHPGPFSEIKAGSKVNVVVAKGRPLLYTPSFLGLSIDFVKQAAKEARIELGQIRYLAITPGAKPKGVVVQQDPPPGLVLAPKQRVALQLSGGAPATAAGERRAGALCHGVAAAPRLAALVASFGGVAAVRQAATCARRLGRRIRLAHVVRRQHNGRSPVVVFGQVDRR